MDPLVFLQLLQSGPLAVQVWTENKSVQLYSFLLTHPSPQTIKKKKKKVSRARVKDAQRDTATY